MFQQMITNIKLSTLKYLSLADDESGDDDDYGTGSSDDDEQKRIKQ